MKEQRKVTFANLISYGVGDIYGGGSFIIISLLFMYFLTDTVGLPGALAGLVMVPGKVWDAISDPLMGYISDNLKTRFGRRRIFFLIGILPVALSFALMWVTIRMDSSFLTFLYYALIFIFFRTSFTMVMVPYSALNAEMTLDYKVRMRLSGARMIFSQLSALICAVVPKLIIDNFYKDNMEEGYMVMAAIFGVFFALPWILVYLGTWEIAAARKKEGASFSNFFSSFKTLFINRSFKVHMGMYILSYAAMDILMAVLIYFLTHYVGKPGLFTQCVGAILLTQVLMLPVYVYIGNLKGKGFAYRLGLSIWGSAMILTLFITPQSPPMTIILISILIGSGLSAGTMIPWAILPSVTDVDEMITAEQRAGSYAGAMTFIRKIVNALTIMIFGFLLDIIGYNRPIMETVNGVSKMVDQVQTESTLFWLKMIFFLAPFILVVAGILIAFKFKITPRTHGILIDELNRLKEGGSKSDVTPETRQVCEELTGLKYEKLYGNHV
ncbi:MAG TPA: MFS transporter [Spirochaetota bacterium]|nr:MFS transporter [Spirochaetota bacterium]